MAYYGGTSHEGKWPLLSVVKKCKIVPHKEEDTYQPREEDYNIIML